MIVFDSADLDAAVEVRSCILLNPCAAPLCCRWQLISLAWSSFQGVIDAIFFNQGLVCSAGSRLLVQENMYVCPAFNKEPLPLFHKNPSMGADAV